MDTVDVLHGSKLDQPISPYKSHIRKNPPKIIQLSPFISKPYDNLLPSNNYYNIRTSSMGLVQTPTPFLAQYMYSYPPYSLQPPPPQPPLLPLPAANPRRGPPANKNSINRTNKSKSPPKKEERTKPIILSKLSNSPVGPDPNEPPKNAAIVLPLGSKGNTGIIRTTTSVDMVPGSMVFTISPPPSSLPLPTKLISCKAEAIGVDAGATDNLRRLLRLQ